MASESNDEAVLEERGKQLGTARTLALSPGATITHRTLAQSEATAMTLHASLPADLPRLSIEARGEPLGPARVARAGSPDYAIVSTLGEGGMGRVHLARQRSLDRDVALKTLKPGAPRDVAAALFREARITGSLEHPGVIPVHLLGLDDDGHPMLVMKRVDGVDLGTLLHDPAHAAWRARGRSEDRLVAGLEILEQVCLTVEFAHSHGILHRDIKPENVMVGSFGEVYLLDWGIAKPKDEPRAETIVGTPVYMAPEMVRGGPVDERSDVYLLGAMLHELLTGNPRHEGTTVMDVLRNALASSLVAYGDDVPQPLAAIANRATHREPAERYPTAGAFRDALADFLKRRSARALADAALERVGALEQALANGGTPADLAGAYRLATEARFGLVQSLREHSDDSDAREAMRRCLVASIELELRQEHAESADALLHELIVPDPTLQARIAELRARAGARAKEHARLERLERDLDPRAEGQRRLVPLLAVSAISGALGLYVLLTGGGHPPTPQTALAIAVAALVVIVTGVIALRRRLLSNAFNRRAAGLLIVGTGGLVLNRVIGLATGTAPTITLTFDLGVMIVACLAGAVTLHPRFAWSVAVLGLGLVSACVWPAHIAPAFIVSTMAAVVVIAWVLPRERTG